MRDGQKVTITRLDFDRLVRAVQAQEVLDLISDMPDEDRELLTSVRYDCLGAATCGIKRDKKRVRSRALFHVEGCST